MVRRNLRENSERAKLAERLIQASAIVSLLLIANSIFEFTLLYDIYSGKDVPKSSFKLEETIGMGLTSVSLAVFLISCISFILWFRRAYYNQEAKFDIMSMSNGWAAAVWFVPIMNLYKPYQMMKELFENAEDYLVKFHLGQSKKSRIRILAWWWFLWIFLRLAENINWRIISISHSAERLMKLTFTSIVIDLLYILLAWLTIRFIRDYNQMEQVLISETSDVEIKIKQHADLLDTQF